MTLVDTSVWIDHFRNENARLRSLLEADGVVTHALVVGELACGVLSPRAQILADLAELRSARKATDEEVMGFIEQRRLWNRGIGFVDAHLVASALLSQCRLWTLDRALGNVARSLHIFYE